jgi:hypothetical protein
MDGKALGPDRPVLSRHPVQTCIPVSLTGHKHGRLLSAQPQHQSAQTTYDLETATPRQPHHSRSRPVSASATPVPPAPPAMLYASAGQPVTEPVDYVLT